MGACEKVAAACIRAVIPGMMLGMLGASPQGAAQSAELTVLTNQGATPGVREVADGSGSSVPWILPLFWAARGSGKSDRTIGRFAPW